MRKTQARGILGTGAKRPARGIRIVASPFLYAPVGPLT